MGDIEDDGAVAVRDCRRAGEKKLRRIEATIVGSAIGLLAAVWTSCDAAMDRMSRSTAPSRASITKSSNKASGLAARK